MPQSQPSHLSPADHLAALNALEIYDTEPSGAWRICRGEDGYDATLTLDSGLEFTLRSDKGLGFPLINELAARMVDLDRGLRIGAIEAADQTRRDQAPWNEYFTETFVNDDYEFAHFDGDPEQSRPSTLPICDTAHPSEAANNAEALAKALLDVADEIRKPGAIGICTECDSWSHTVKAPWLCHSHSIRAAQAADAAAVTA